MNRIIKNSSILQKISLKKNGTFILAFAFYILILGSVSLYSYWDDREICMTDLDKRLSVGAASIKHILPQDFHDRAINADAISPDEDSKIINDLSIFTRKAGFEFIYTLIKIDQKIYITSSSATQEEVAAGTVVRYFTLFDEADPPFLEAFETKQPTAFTHVDRWGTFRAFILPEKSLGGIPFLSVSEYEISDIQRTLRKTIFRTFVFALLLLVACIPLFFYFLKKEKQNSEQLRKSEATLRRSHERFFTVMNSLPATIYVADLETYEILFMNQPLIDNFGKNLTGQQCWKELKGKSRPCEECFNKSLIDESGTPTDVKIWHEKSKENQKWYTNYDRVIEWIDGRMVKLQISTDITDLKAMEERLRKAQKMESIGDLAAGIAHDFNNLLFPIIGLSEMLLEDLPQGNLEYEHIQEIYLAGKRGSELVKQILAFSRQSEHKMTPIYVQTVLEEVLKLSRSTIPSNFEITHDIQPDCGLVMADATQIHQTSLNLITNAYHAMDELENGVIDVQLRELSQDQIVNGNELFSETSNIMNRYLKLSVTDTGSGIDPAIRDKIFDPYFTTKTKGKGTGLGLSVVYGIVKEHNGSITVDSKPGKGSSFNVFLPLLEKASKIEPDKLIKNSKTGSEHILLVDDEKAVANLEKLMLERLGYTVTSRLSSLEALELFKTKPNSFDLIISDRSMPGMTGERLSKELKSIRPNIPIIICTGFSEQFNQKKAKLEGIDGILMKPVLKSQLAEMVRKVLEA